MTASEIIIPPALTTAQILYLRDGLAELGETVNDTDRLVYGWVPEPRPAKFLTVVRIGGFTRDRVVFNSTHLYEAWAGGVTEAGDLADRAYALMHSIVGRQHDVTFYGTDDIAGPANLPDPESNQARFVFTLSVRARSAAA